MAVNANVTTPLSHAWDITPNDSTDLQFNGVTQPTRALFVGTAGNIRVTLRDGGTVTLNNVQSGTLLPLIATRVLATGTDATNIVGFV